MQYKEVIGVLQLVRSCSTQSPLVSALFMDELSTAIQRGDICPQVEVSGATSVHM